MPEADDTVLRGLALDRGAGPTGFMSRKTISDRPRVRKARRVPPRSSPDTVCWRCEWPLASSREVRPGLTARSGR